MIDNKPKEVLTREGDEISALQAANEIKRWIDFIDRENPGAELATMRRVLSIKTWAQLIVDRADELLKEK